MNGSMSNSSTANPIAALRDVAGVVGSFVVSADGQLLLKDLPAVFDESLFQDVAPRLLRLGEVLGDRNAPPETISMRFAEHRLHVRFLKQGAAMGTISTLVVNSATLRMAVTLTARRVEQVMGERLAVSSERPTLPSPEAQHTPVLSSSRPSALGLTAEAAPGSSEAKAKARVLYRGRPI